MKKIFFKLMLLPAMVLPLLFTSCSDDNDSNPTLDLSHAADGFVLNTPAYAEKQYIRLGKCQQLDLVLYPTKLWRYSIRGSLLCAGSFG